MDLFKLEILYMFVLFFVPGYISFKVWRLLVPSEQKKPGDYLTEIVFYSCLNFAAMSWLIIIFSNKDTKIWIIYLSYIIVLFLTPIIWPVLLSKVRPYFKDLLHSMPKSWDYFFSKREACWVLVHLKNGSLIGGYYGKDSFASRYPNIEDIYLQEVWKVDKNGKFGEKIERTKGLWIDKNEFTHLEFFR